MAPVVEILFPSTHSVGVLSGGFGTGLGSLNVDFGKKVKTNI